MRDLSSKIIATFISLGLLGTSANAQQPSEREDSPRLDLAAYRIHDALYGNLDIFAPIVTRPYEGESLTIGLDTEVRRNDNGYLITKYTTSFYTTSFQGNERVKGRPSYSTQVYTTEEGIVTSVESDFEPVDHWPGSLRHEIKDTAGPNSSVDGPFWRGYNGSRDGTRRQDQDSRELRGVRVFPDEIAVAPYQRVIDLFIFQEREFLSTPQGRSR